jgi:hypothetical protein
MSLSTTLVPYRNTDAAALILHQSFSSNKAELVKICKTLTIGGQAVVKFLVASDASSAASDHRLLTAKTYQAAMIYIQRTGEKSLKYQTRICEYATDGYLKEEDEVEDSTDMAWEAPGESALTIREPSPRDIVLQSYPIIDMDSEQETRLAEAERSVPQAFNILNSLRRIFKDGVILPADRRFFSIKLDVYLNLPGLTPKLRFQRINMNRSTKIGLIPKERYAQKEDKDSWTELGIGTGCDYSFDESRREVTDGRIPLGVPLDARLIQDVRQRSLVDFISNGGGNSGGSSAIALVAPTCPRLEDE